MIPPRIEGITDAGETRSLLPLAGPGHLLLIGPMGGGKSSVGRRLAELTGRHFEDTDAMVRRDQGGAEIAEIFARRGEPFFRAREAAALASLAGRPAGLVVATGGGIVLREENRRWLRELGVVAWVTASEDVLLARVSRTRKRPLLQTADPRATLRALLQARESLYADCAHFCVDTSEGSHAQIAATVLARVREVFPDGGF